jgi:hypothetical protein
MLYLELKNSQEAAGEEYTIGFAQGVKKQKKWYRKF